MGRSTTKATVKTTEADAASEVHNHGSVTVGDTVKLGPGNHFVRFPDGTAVTARSEYVATAIYGEYAVLDNAAKVIQTFTVEKAADDDTADATPDE